MDRAATFIHLKYGIDKRMEVMELDSRHFTIVRDILKRERYKFKHCIIHMYNEHGTRMKLEDIVYNARVYTIKRHPP